MATAHQRLQGPFPENSDGLTCLLGRKLENAFSELSSDVSILTAHTPWMMNSSLRSNGGSKHSLAVSGPPLHLYIDASTSDQSRGAVLVTPGEIYWTTKREISTEHINIAELKAATLALDTFQPMLRHRTFVLWTDSKSVHGWLINKRGHTSTSQRRELLIAFWLRCLHTKAWPWIMYVPSACNVADWASRQQHFGRLASFPFVEPVEL